MVLQKKTFVYKRFGYHFPAVQITVPTKSQGTQCTLLKEMFLTSTPCASDDEPSDSEEEMDADDDSLYVPEPEDEMAEDGDFADFDMIITCHMHSFFLSLSFLIIVYTRLKFIRYTELPNILNLDFLSLHYTTYIDTPRFTLMPCVKKLC